MTFLGKVLIVVQVVLSFCFMAFAGAVFAVHQNWRAQFNTADQMVDTLRGELDTARGEFQAERDQIQQQIDDADAEATLQGNNARQADTLLQAANRDNQLLAQEISRLEGEQERAALEANFRQEEAEQQRTENLAQQAALDAIQTEQRTANDTIFAQGVELAELQRRFTDLQETSAHYLALLNQNGIDPLTRLLGDILAPPPPVDGRIMEVSLDEAGRPKLVQISLGEDDGLQDGHVLDVYRIVNGETLYIGQIKITSTLPDRAVADVLNENRNGIIEVADYVTTKL